jgi:NTE family protein
MGVNPLRDLLKELIVEEHVQSCAPLKLFVTATNVETGKPRVFRGDEVTVAAVMASASLPFVYQAAEIEGLPYWDGGYMGNPVIWPMIYECKSTDVVLVQINPLVRPGTPKSSVEIINRVNEISFNSSMMAELRAIYFVQRLLTNGLLKEGAERDLKHMHMHMIQAEAAMIELGAASKMNAELDFLLHLRELGRHTADRWLAANWNNLGKRNSIDLKAILA